MFRRRNPTGGGEPPKPPEPMPPTASPASSPMPVTPPPVPPVPPAPLLGDAPGRSPLPERGYDMNTPKAPSPAAPSPFKADIPRRVVDIPGAPKRPEGGQVEVRKLIVGRDISLSGEITACDVLVVEGTVEARLRDGRTIEIAETGLFKGSVEIDEADIAGRFEGEITVRGRLRLRAGGRIQGSIRYGELEVEAGGQLSGDIQVIDTVRKPAVDAPGVRAPVETF
jgi:cytoskeletal protein CcmA (bactofilin family)